MRMYDIILKKRNGGTLTDAEIKEMIAGYCDGTIPDYQMSAFLMAVYFKGMTHAEISTLTQCMAYSGETVDLSGINGVKVDKHSSGGVGDKTTLIVTPIVAACGAKVAKMTGRGLGHTGGTADKLESIKGFRIALDQKDFFNQVNDIGIAVIGATGNLAPADKKMYALRDVTATVDSIPLIAASIMSKKIAAGSDCIMLDVKVGSGAFVKEVAQAKELSELMVQIGERAGRRTAALITNMDVPLGKAIGNAVEVIEAVGVLKGHGEPDLVQICISLAANILVLAGKGTYSACEELALDAIQSGAAFTKLCQMVKAQGGDTAMLSDTSLFPCASVRHEIKAPQNGYIAAMDTEKCGRAATTLGAGRAVLNSPIDYSAGILLKKKTGDVVQKGEVLAELRTNDQDSVARAEELFLSSLVFSASEPEKKPLLYALVNKDGIHTL